MCLGDFWRRRKWLITAFLRCPFGPRRSLLRFAISEYIEIFYNRQRAGASELPIACRVHAALISESARCLARWAPRIPSDLSRLRVRIAEIAIESWLFRQEILLQVAQGRVRPPAERNSGARASSVGRSPWRAARSDGSPGRMERAVGGPNSDAGFMRCRVERIFLSFCNFNVLIDNLKP